MIAPLILGIAQVASPAPGAASDDVVVIGRKLAKWTGTIRTNPFGTKCVTKQSTGDPEIDRIGCTALEQCWPETQARLQVALKVKGPKADRQRAVDAAAQGMATCSRPKRDALIDELAGRRAAAQDAAP